VGRDIRIPDFARSRLPKSKTTGVGALFGALFVVVVAAVLIPGHGASTGTGVVIPPPPAITVNGQVVEPGALSGSGMGLPVIASMPAKARPSAKPAPSSAATHPRIVSPPPIAGSGYAGGVLLNATGATLTSWNQTSSFCSGQSWEVGDGTVSTDSSGDAVLTTTGKAGSCVGLISPSAYSSAVIEAYIYFPPLPGKPDTIADWTSVWLTDQATWPVDGELDAVEAEPVTGVNATAWHGGTTDNPLWMSTDGFAQDGTLPKNGPNLTPGWHVVDIVYTKGFFAVYYDGRQFTSLSSDVVTGSPLNILITTSVTPDISQVEQTIGGPPLNSDSSPAGMAVKYVKIWSYK
jgi:hypothetical protein